ncbi:MAG: shikimate dehydrogenase [Lachnospiraceae bacterium]|nr:shikimate dehydrogenase [Lachnospiraceae bacterium]
MHNMAFKELGIDCEYIAYDVDEDGLEAKVKDLLAENVLGFNLTMPDKQKMCSLCDELSDAARISGSVNTVYNDGGRLIGHTTDGIGFMRACADAGFDPIGRKMVILGAGGAACSILVQAALDGVSEITVFNRKGKNWDKISGIIGILRNETGCRILLSDYDPEVIRREVSEAALLTNATSVGMAPHEEASPIEDQSVFRSGPGVFDIIYNPPETKLMRLAKEAGCRVANGKLMLLYQGAAAFKIWTGREMPIEKVKAALFSD